MALAFAVAQFGNKLLLFCYHSFTILACSGKTSATLLPQNQNFSQMRSILLFCYLSSRIFLPFYHLINILLFCYLSRIFVTATLLSLKQSHFSAKCFMISYYNELKVIKFGAEGGGGGGGLAHARPALVCSIAIFHI